ncbi:MAG: DUF4150 domain-containing protein [Reinekea sp.]
MNNVLINGRSAVHKESNGKLMTTDVCLTRIGNSVVPIPYLNIAQSSDAAKTASSVKINGQPVCTKDSIFSKSKGDEPGNKKGVKSGTKGGEASFIMASPNVKIEGCFAARALDSMVSNKQNTPPMPLIQPMGMPPIPLPAASVAAPEGVETNIVTPSLRIKQPYSSTELPVLVLSQMQRQFPFQYDGEAWCFKDPMVDQVTVQQITVFYACQQGMHVERLYFHDDNHEPGYKHIYLIGQGNWQATLYIQHLEHNHFVDKADIPVQMTETINMWGSAWRAPITLKMSDVYRLHLQHTQGSDLYSQNTLYIEKHDSIN